MKKTIIYSVTFFLAFFLTTNFSLAHRVEPRVNSKYIIVHRPATPKVVFHGSTVVRSGYVWVNGHYAWNKRTRSYEWVRGRYIKEKRGKVWIDGHWRRVRGGWAYQPGHWQRVIRF